MVDCEPHPKSFVFRRGTAVTPLNEEAAVGIRAAYSLTVNICGLAMSPLVVCQMERVSLPHSRLRSQDGTVPAR